jgi:hypothetical protein
MVLERHCSPSLTSRDLHACNTKCKNCATLQNPCRMKVHLGIPCLQYPIPWARSPESGGRADPFVTSTSSKLDLPTRTAALIVKLPEVNKNYPK